MPKDLPLRPNTGIIVFNRKLEVLAGERLDPAGSWQLPQGGIDEGESPREAAIRELYEEMGLRMPAPDLEFPDWLEYIFPPGITENLKGFRGQRQKWFLYHWEGDPARLNLKVHKQEFRRAAWKTLPFLAENIVSFKQGVYRTLVNKALPMMQDFLKDSRKEKSSF